MFFYLLCDPLPNQMQSVLADSDSGGPAFDSNCITPGTAFMEVLDRYMKYFIQRKVK